MKRKGTYPDAVINRATRIYNICGLPKKNGENMREGNVLGMGGGWGVKMDMNKFEYI